MNPITSHRHGKGRFADYAWGSVESCAECAAEKARDEARQAWAREYQEELKAMETNRLLQQEEKVSVDSVIRNAALKAISLGCLTFWALMLVVPVLGTEEDVDRIWAFWKSVF